MNPYFQNDMATLYHADCRDIDAPCDLIVTDPPYGQEFVSGRAGGRWGALIGDDEPETVEECLAHALKGCAEGVTSTSFKAV